MLSFYICHDAEHLTSKYQNFLKTWDYLPLEEVKESLGKGHYSLYFAEQEKVLVGVLFVMRSDDFMDVMYLYIDPSFRRKGHAHQLLNECERVEKLNPHMRRFLLEVRADNIAAQKLYESFGMKQISRRNKYYKDGCDALIYEKVI